MKERPILFSAPMVRAILAGRKTQTRRTVKTTDAGRVKEPGSARNWHLDDPNAVLACPYGQPGDRLWVRETWNVDQCYDDLSPSDLPGSLTDSGIATDPQIGDVGFRAGFGMEMTGRWRPSIHMPRWASRITLEITWVGLERLNAIRATDCIEEGIEPYKRAFGDAIITTFRDYPFSDAIITTFRDYLTGATDRAASNSFRTLWESINGPGSWAANPQVWVVHFRRIDSKEGRSE